MQLRLVVLVAAAVAIFFGMTRLSDVPVDVLPEFSRPYVEVQTEALGLSAEEVEAMITVPLEADMLNGVSWVEEIRSESIPGLSSIVLFFEPGIDMLVARQMVMERLTETHTLPGVAKPPKMLNPLSSSGRFLKVGVTSEEHSLIDLSVLAHWTLAPRLMGVPGVAHVSVWGERSRQLQVQVDPYQLRDMGVKLSQIIATAGNALWVSPLSFLDASTPGTGGWIETPNQRLQIQHLLPITTPEELSRVVVQGTNYTLAEVTNVVEDHQPLIGDAVVNDSPALMLVIEKFPWANTVEVTHGVEETLAALSLGLPGVEMDSTLFRPATYVELAVANLGTALAIGLVLAIAALFALLLNWRTALVSGLAVVLSGIAALGVLYVRGETLDMMVIAGLMIALVILIDDAVMDVQNIARRLRERRDGDDSKSVAMRIFEAAIEMRSPIVYATLIVLLALVPVFFLQGVAQAFAQPVALSYALALLASMVVALTVTPALSLLLLDEDSGEERESPVIAGLRGALEGLVPRGDSGPALRIGVAVLGVVVLIGAIALPQVRSVQDVLPTFRERDILINLDGAPGTSEAAMSRLTTRATKELRAIPGVRTVSAHVGRAVMSDRVADVNSGELWVNIDDADDYEATVAAISDVISGYPGFDIDVATYLGERILEETEDDEALVVRVYGENFDGVQSKAEEVRGLLTRIDGVVSPEVDYPDTHPALEIEVDLERAKRYGVKPGDVRRSAATLLSGLEVGNLFEEQKVFDVVVWGTPEIRKNITDVGELLIDSPTRGHVRLKDVADIRVASSPKVITREAVARHMDVRAGVSGDPETVIAEIEDRVRKEIQFPLEFRAEVLSGFEQRREARQQVVAFAVAAAIGIVLLLQAAFGSWTLAGYFFLSLPVAVLGGVVAASVTGDPTALGSLLGLVAVFAIATRSGVTLVRHYRSLEKREGGFSAELVARGTRERLGPVLMTAIVAAAAFLPFIFLGGIAGLEILHPMAIAVLGGLVTSTVVTLGVVPRLYLSFGGEVEPDVLVEEEPPRLVA
jgi:Cu/Ag efflux pump CusA